MKKLVGVGLVAILLCFTMPAYALNQPAVNLGFTNFLDGASPGPGWYLTEYLQIVHASKLENDFGIPEDANIDAFINLNQVIYQSDINFLGGNPGVDIIVPLVDLDINHPFLKAQDGVGDVLIGPFMQWGDAVNGPKMLFGRPSFHRIELQITAPTGENSNDYALNPGADVWTINPYYSFTYFITPKLTTSWRIHYLWSSENKNADFLGGAFEDVQAGQAIHFNYALAYQVSDILRLGVAGYYLNQFEEDDYSGPGAGPFEDDSEEEVFAIGPGLVLHINKDLTFMGAVNFETSADNRPEGVRSTLRLIWKFW